MVSNVGVGESVHQFRDKAPFVLKAPLHLPPSEMNTDGKLIPEATITTTSYRMLSSVMTYSHGLLISVLAATSTGVPMSSLQKLTALPEIKREATSFSHRCES